MARRLKNLVIDRVDLVDKGANQKASIVLTKRDTSGERGEHEKETQKNSPALATVHVDGIGGKKKKPKETGVEKKNLFKRIIGLFSEEDVAKREAELEAISEDIDKMSAEEGTDAVGGKKKKKSTPPDDDADDQPTAKQLQDVAKMESLEKRVKDAEEMAKAERGARLDGEMVTVLKGFKATAFNVNLADEKNDVLKFRKMKEVSPEAFERTMELLRAHDQVIADSSLFKNYGSGASGSATALAQLEAKAAEMITKGDKGLTKEAAFAKACEENPALTWQYRAEQQ